jgi:hypothetical protein
VQVDQSEQLFRQMPSPLGLALGECLFGAIVGCGQVIDTRQHVAELLAVGDHAPDRDAAKSDAVVPAFAADEARARALAPRLMVAEGDLQRRIDGLAARVGEECIVEIAGGEQSKP